MAFLVLMFSGFRVLLISVFVFLYFRVTERSYFHVFVHAISRFRDFLYACSFVFVPNVGVVMGVHENEDSSSQKTPPADESRAKQSNNYANYFLFTFACNNKILSH